MASSITPVIQEYTVDFASNNNFVYVKAVQGDGHSVRYVDVTMVAAGRPYTVETDKVRAVIRGTKPDNKEIFNTCEFLNDNTVRVELTQQMTAVPGKVNAEISIMDLEENSTLTSFAFFIFVEPNAADVSYITSSDEFTLLVQKINDVSDSVIEADEAIKDLNNLNATVTSQENSRVEAEKKRVSAESGRVAAENNRVEAEQGRVTAENNRVSAESKRVTAENARASAETAREKAEDTRESNEDTRKKNETARVSAETARGKAETARASAESARASAETARKNAETGRVNAEKARVAAEDGRADAEAQRVKNENTRISNENTRQSQETSRQTNTATAIADAEEATAAAWEAIEKIQEGIGIDDTTESYSTVWSSKHTMDVIKERYYRKSLQNITIQPSGWANKMYYIKNDRISADSVVDIYYNADSFDEVNRAYLKYTLGDGYIQFRALINPIENIVIDNILIENYTEPETYTAGGTL